MSTPLCTVASIRTLLPDLPATGQAATDTDSALQLLIDTASAWFETETGVKIESETYTRDYHGTGSQMLMLRERPITFVVSVRIGDRDVPRSCNPSDPGFAFDERCVYLRGCYRFDRGIQNVRVIHQAGFDDVPEDVAGWCREAVMLAFKRNPNLDYSSKTLAGETIAFWRGALPPQANAIMQAWKRKVPA